MYRDKAARRGRRHANRTTPWPRVHARRRVCDEPAADRGRSLATVVASAFRRTIRSSGCKPDARTSMDRERLVQPMSPPVRPRRAPAQVHRAANRALDKGAVNVKFRGQPPEGGGPPNRHGMPQAARRPARSEELAGARSRRAAATSTGGTWKLEVGGARREPGHADWEQFLALPQVDDVSDFHCVTTWSRYDNHWRGVRFKTIAELAVPTDEARVRPLHRLRLRAGHLHPLHDEPAARSRDRRRRAAGPHLGGTAAAARARRSRAG